jgi:hypothetical protein
MVKTSKRTRRSLTVAAATLAGVGVISGGLTGGMVSAKAESIQEAGVEQVAGYLAKSLLTGIIGKGGAGIFDSIFGELAGDPTADELEKIEAKQNELAIQITKVDADINAVKSTIDENRFQDSIKELSDLSALYNQMYLNTYKPIAEVALDVKRGNKTEADLESAKQDFVNEYANGQSTLDSHAQQIHQSLAPGMTDSLIKQYGQVLMDKGYLNSADSQKLQDTMAWAQDIEAIATFMEGEYYAATGSTKTVDRVEEQFAAWNKTETDSLPPAIPQGQIVLPQNNSTKGAAVLKTTGDESVQWLLDENPMTAIEKQNPGWTLPTSKTMMATKTAVQSAPGEKTTEKLAQAASPGQGSPAWSAAVGTTGLVWTSDTAKTNEVPCGVGPSAYNADTLEAKKITFTVHKAASLDTDKAQPIAMPNVLPNNLTGDPLLVDNISKETRASCVKTLNGYLTSPGLPSPMNATAGVVLTQTSTIDYMAQTPN